jgi:uncharacterized GH25 family protein
MNRILRIAFVLSFSLATVFGGQEKTGTLKGKIEDDKGKPIAGAEVRVMRSRDRSVKEAKSDQTGSYTLELVPDDYSLSFDAEGYRGGTLVQMQQVEEGKETVVKTIRLARVKERTSLVRGAVFDSQGASLAGARVKLNRVPTDEEAKEKKHVSSHSMSYTTNSRGEFAFRLPAVRARYEVTASADGYKSETKTVEVSESEAVPLAFSLEPGKKK